MDVTKNQPEIAAAQGRELSQILDPVRAIFLEADETRRYQLLATLLTELADIGAGGSDGQRSVSREEFETLGKKYRNVDEERATLDDTLKTAQADLTERDKQLAAARTLAEERQLVIDNQGQRLDEMKKEVSALEAELVAKNAALHKSEVESDNLTLRAQRAEHVSTDRGAVDRLERDKADLIVQLEETRAQTEQARKDKEAEIHRLQDQLRDTKSGASTGGQELMVSLWERLAKQKTPLVEGHLSPTPQCFERLVDGYGELVKFADDFDKSIRPFLSKYTRHDPSVRVPWDAYVKRDEIRIIAERTLAPQGGRPVGVLRMRLSFLYKWVNAAILGCDSAIESVASELDGFLRSNKGIGSDPKRTIKEFVRSDGHELFREHLLQILSTTLAQVFGRG